MTPDVNRREFLKIAAGTGAALAVPALGHATASTKMIGIQQRGMFPRLLFNERIDRDKGHRGHTRLDLRVLAPQDSLGTLERFTAEQWHMFACYLD